MLPCGESMTLTPPASARSTSWVLRLWQARWSATSEEEHAVSTATLGPWRSRRSESRFTATLAAFPGSE